jgi:hypothetical protein
MVVLAKRLEQTCHTSSGLAAHERERERERTICHSEFNLPSQDLFPQRGAARASEM